VEITNLKWWDWVEILREIRNYFYRHESKLLGNVRHIKYANKEKEKKYYPKHIMNDMGL